MQLPKDFWAFSFELTNSHLFQQNLMPALHDNDVTVTYVVVSVNVVANSNWSCLLISAPKVHWREQPTAARRNGRFKKMHGALRALHVSLNNAIHEIVPRCLKRNNGHLMTLQIWTEWRYCRVWGATHEASLKPTSEAQNSFWIKNRTSEDMGHFSAGPINKAVSSFVSSLTRVRERWWKSF